MTDSDYPVLKLGDPVNVDRVALTACSRNGSDVHAQSRQLQLAAPSPVGAQRRVACRGDGLEVARGAVAITENIAVRRLRAWRGAVVAVEVIWVPGLNQNWGLRV